MFGVKHPLTAKSAVSDRDRNFPGLWIFAGLVSAFACMAQEQGPADSARPRQNTDRFGIVTLEIPPGWHDRTEARLAEMKASENRRGGYAGSDLLLEVTKDGDKFSKGRAGCMFISRRLQGDQSAESAKNLVERAANDLHESYKNAELADFLKRGLTVSAFHAIPRRVELEKSQEVGIDGRSGWQQLWTVSRGGVRTPLVSITSAVMVNAQQSGKEQKALIVQCTFTGEDARSPIWGGTAPEERVRRLLETVRVGASEAVAVEAFSPAARAAQQSAEARRSAEEWLALVDSGNYADSWHRAGSRFRNSITQDQWVQVSSGARQPLGSLMRRSPKSGKWVRSLPGGPDGTYAVMQFEAAFANKAAAVETVTTALEPDGSWRVVGYFIQ